MALVQFFQALPQAVAVAVAVTITAHQIPVLVAGLVVVVLVAHLLKVMLEVLALKAITAALALEIQTTTAAVAAVLEQLAHPELMDILAQIQAEMAALVLTGFLLALLMRVAAVAVFILQVIVV
jgi:hypothetical protein